MVGGSDKNGVQSGGTAADFKCSFDLPDALRAMLCGDDTCAIKQVVFRLVAVADLPDHQEGALDDLSIPVAPLTYHVDVVEGPDDTKGRGLLFFGTDESEPGVVRLTAAAPSSAPDHVARLPRTVHASETEEARFLIAADHLEGLDQDFDLEAFRGRGLRANLDLLIDLAGTIGWLHDQGFAVGGLEPWQLVTDASFGAVAIRQLGQLIQLSESSSEMATRAIRADVRALGELLVEAVTGDPAAETLPALSNLLDDIEALNRKNLALAGLAQLLVGSLTDERPFVYANAGAFLDGLLQLRVEMIAPLTFRTGIASTAGNFPLRRTDQDSCGYTEARVAYHGMIRHLGYYCVADGVGGEEHGERASQSAVNSALEGFHRAVAHYDLETLYQQVTPLARLLVKVAAQGLAIVGEADPDENRGATTFTGIVICDDRLGIGHAGDSRAYLSRGGHFHRLTRDHNLANVKVALGELTEREARTRHDDQRRISRFVGTSSETPMSWVDGFDPALLLSLVNQVSEPPLPEINDVPTRENKTVRVVLGPSEETQDITGDVSEVQQGFDPQSTTPFDVRESTASRSSVRDIHREDRARTGFIQLRAGDKILIMSDGLYGEVADAEMAAILKTSNDPEVTARRLLETALDGMASDNVTVVVLQVGSAPPNYRR